MKIIKSIFIFFTLTILIISCSSFREAGDVLRNEKGKSTDEFLIKKKEPLTQPPDFETIPRPGISENKTKDEKNNIKKLLKKSRSEPSTGMSKSSSVEKSILSKIKK
tara:strand:+ start:1296 stop:1616 length:321 start_codon:yes stop_codon:yes gene_type:complete